MDCDGEKVLCADLVHATVIEHRLNDWELSAQCYRTAENELTRTPAWS